MDNRERRRRIERKRREQEIRLQMFVLAVGAALLLFLVIVGIGRWREAVAERKRLEAERALQEREEELLSDSVLEYEDLVKYYAEEEGIYEYVPVLLAIMEVETKGERDDVMQSSESAGLEPNSLGPEASIAQACDYFRGLVERAENTGVDDKTIIQAYNYGPGYIYYVEENGGVHSFDLAVDYAEEMSGGRTSRYICPELCQNIAAGFAGRRKGKMEETNGIKIKAKHLVRKTAEDWTARDVGTCASSIAFFFFMSMIPLLIIIFQMLPLFGLSEFDLISFLDRMIPEAMQGFAAIVVSQAYKYSKGTLSLSVITLVWSASKGTMPYPVQVLLAIGYTAALLVMFALMLFLVFVGPVSTYLTEVLPEFITKPITIEMHDQVLITLLMLVIFVMVYLRQFPGALLDAVVWIIFSELFSIYVEGNNAYSMFYGSLGGIAILLFWLYCCFYIVLIGAFFNRFCGEQWDQLVGLLRRRGKKE